MGVAAPNMMLKGYVHRKIKLPDVVKCPPLTQSSGLSITPQLELDSYIDRLDDEI
jgi:hypothetical protein